MSEENKMDKITSEMMEHICDNLCKNPKQLGISEQELEEICLECKMGKYVCDILNTYNDLNNFEKTQCAALLKKIPKWIPVEDKTPDERQEVLATDGKYVYLVEYESDYGYGYMDGITGWMPLPEPYRGI